MSNKLLTSKYALFFIIIIAIVISAFLLLDFKAATSQTNTQSQSSSYSTNNTEIDFSGGLLVFIDGDNSISKNLEDKVLKNLSNIGIQVSLIDEFKNDYQKPVLILAIRNIDILYTPFYSTANIESFYFYSSEGDTEYYKGFKNEENPVVRFYSNESNTGEFIKQGTLELEDTTKGVISLKAYYNHLEENLANSIIKNFLPAE